jgi:transcriptional regulator with XRE-family HTH domain
MTEFPGEACQVSEMQDHVQAGPTIRRRRLGTDLRRLRQARSLRLEDVAARLEVAPSTLSRIETGKAPTRTSYLTVMLDLYGVDDPGQRERMAGMAREGQRKGWWAPCDDLLPAGAGSYLGLEAAACAIRCFAVDVVPGLVQTRGYAAAVYTASRPGLSADQVGRLAWLQTRRREMLADGVQLHLVLDEAVLRRAIGPPGVMAAQLEHLLAVAAWPWASVQAPSLARSRPVLSDSFTLLSFADQADPDVGYVSGVRGQAIRQERAADVRAMQNIFAELSRAALTPPETTGLITGLIAHARS